MRINKISSQPNFQAVNQKYFEWAKKDFARGGDITTEWLLNLRFDVFLFKKIKSNDAIDTLNAIKKYMNKTNKCIETLLENLRAPNP